MRAAHKTTADEIDMLIHGRGKPGRKKVKQASARKDRRQARREMANA